MRFTLFILFSTAFSLLFTFCNNTNPSNSPLSGIQEVTALPKTVKPSDVTLMDVNCWSEGEMFYATGIISSNEMFWKRFWLELEVVNSENQLLKIKSDSFSIVPAHAYATPPRGRTTFFWAWKLSDIAGKPDSIHLRAAQGQETSPGAILLVSNQSGVRMLKDSVTELGWMVTGTLDNPLPLVAQDPCLDVLLYGKDNKLWFTQAFDMNKDTTLVKSATWGPVSPNEKRGFGFNLAYDALPEALKKQLIGRVDIFAFEKR